MALGGHRHGHGPQFAFSGEFNGSFWVGKGLTGSFGCGEGKQESEEEQAEHEISRDFYYWISSWLVWLANILYER